MRFRLPRQIVDDCFRKIIVREIKSQKIPITKPSKIFLKSMAKACREIEKEGLPKKFVLKKVKGMGYGIFLHPEADVIERGEVIAPYAGVVTLFPQNAPDESGYAFSPIMDIHLTKEEQSQFDPKRSFRPNRLYALDLDAVKKGNFTRFINHSEKPNIDAEIVSVPKNRLGLEPSLVEIVYVAKKKIRPGEQLLVCYEGEEGGYWDAMGIKPREVNPRTFMLSRKNTFFPRHIEKAQKLRTLGNFS